MTVALRKHRGLSGIRVAAKHSERNDIPAMNSLAKTEAHKRLESFRNLVNGWDGYHAKAINSDTAKRAATLIDRLPVAPEVFPTLDGNIQFQFEDKSNNYLELELRSDGTAEFYMEMVGMDTEERVIDLRNDAEQDYLFGLVSKFI